MAIRVPFNRPSVSGRELALIQEAIANLHLSGNGKFTRRCQAWLTETIGSPQALLTHSCTAALEMAALLAEIGPGDEIIMPSFTFVSTANAFVLRGATPVFVDVRPDTLNIDETRLERAITPRTRVIVVVHYAGVACDMDTICAIASGHGLLVVEDAAQALLSTYKGRPLGSIGQAAAVSFHETKNVIAGEGGALLVNKADWTDRAEVLWEKGTNRVRFGRGEVDKYTWIDVGSSFLPSEINAAFLYAQLERAQPMIESRVATWHRYHDAFASLEACGVLRRPIVPDGCSQNGHMYYVLLADGMSRLRFLEHLAAQGINAVSHYVPLHTSPAGRRLGRASGPLDVTESVAGRLVRLPLWPSMSDADVTAVVEAVCQWAESV